MSQLHPQLKIEEETREDKIEKLKKKIQDVKSYEGIKILWLPVLWIVCLISSIKGDFGDFNLKEMNDPTWIFLDSLTSLILQCILWIFFKNKRICKNLIYHWLSLVPKIGFLVYGMIILKGGHLSNILWSHHHRGGSVDQEGMA